MPWDGNRWKGKPPTVEELLGPEDSAECECCGMDGIPLEVYEQHNGSRRREESRREDRPPFKALCDPCSHSIAANAWEDGGYAPGVLEITRTICVVGNLILKELRKQREK